MDRKTINPNELYLIVGISMYSRFLRNSQVLQIEQITLSLSEFNVGKEEIHIIEWTRLNNENQSQTYQYNLSTSSTIVNVKHNRNIILELPNWESLFCFWMVVVVCFSCFCFNSFPDFTKASVFSISWLFKSPISFCKRSFSAIKQIAASFKHPCALQSKWYNLKME